MIHNWKKQLAEAKPASSAGLSANDNVDGFLSSGVGAFLRDFQDKLNKLYTERPNQRTNVGWLEETLRVLDNPPKGVRLTDEQTGLRVKVDKWYENHVGQPKWAHIRDQLEQVNPGRVLEDYALAGPPPHRPFGPERRGRRRRYGSRRP